VDEIDDSIGVDDTVKKTDDDLTLVPEGQAVIQAPIVPSASVSDQTSPPTLSIDTPSKEGDSPGSSYTSLIGGMDPPLLSSLF
jgi:hypothetical protein